MSTRRLDRPSLTVTTAVDRGGGNGESHEIIDWARSEAAPKRVLIVERDPNVRDLQKYFLNKAGIGVEFVDDGQAALLRAQQTPPALIVTEILIPTLDGLTLCRRLRDDPITSGVPVIVFSILAAGGRAAEAGAKAFLRKPLVETVFVATVQDLIAAQPAQLSEEQWASQ